MQTFYKYISEKTQLEISIVQYSFSAIFSTIFCFSSAILICSLFNGTYFAILFIALFSPLKIQFTSYHCKTLFTCTLSYSFLLLFNLFAFRFLITQPTFAFYISFFAPFLFLLAIFKQFHEARKIVIFAYFIIFYTSVFINCSLTIILTLILLSESFLILLFKFKSSLNRK